MAATQVLAGVHAVIARMRQAPATIREVYVEAQRRDKRMQTLLDQLAQAGVSVHPVAVARLDGLAGGSRHQGVVAVAESRKLANDLDEVLDEVQGPAFLLILDGITDPHNLGACLRSADAFGVHAVLAPKDRSAGLSAVVMKAASGAAESVPYLTVTNLARALRDLKDRNILIVGTDDDAPCGLMDADFTAASALILGAEGAGMRRLTREHCDLLVSIPMFGQVESLNVSVSAGVCLYEARRQRMLAGK